jgi:hypothetical protein
MRKFLIAGIAAFALGCAGAAVAAESPAAGPAGSGPASSDSIRKDLEGMGYRVVRVAAEHDTYKVRATDAETGQSLKLTYSGSTGELIKAKLRH